MQYFDFPGVFCDMKTWRTWLTYYGHFILSAAFLTQTVCLDDTTVKFEIWDTAGQERYHSLAPMYYRGAQAAIVVYDITNEVSTGVFPGEISFTLCFVENIHSVKSFEVLLFFFFSLAIAIFLWVSVFKNTMKVWNFLYTLIHVNILEEILNRSRPLCCSEYQEVVPSVTLLSDTRVSDSCGLRSL